MNPSGPAVLSIAGRITELLGIDVHGSAVLLATIAGILALGVGSRVLADRHNVPSVFFLIFAGLLLGPIGFDLVSQETFGDGLVPMVGACVAIILFEGSFKLGIDDLRRAPKAIGRLVTLGAVIMWLGTAAAVSFVLDVGFEIGLVVGALLIATGPTVITPILNVTPLREHVGTTMEAEGIINDVHAAILAVVVFEVLVVEDGSYLDVGIGFLYRLLIGITVGLIVGYAIIKLLSIIDQDPDHASLHSKLVVLAAVLVAYGGAELIAGETGIAAAAALGFVFGNTDVPHQHEVEAFMEDLTVIVLSFLFVALAALIEFEDILALGVEGAIVALLLLFLVRPLLIFISVREPSFTRNERLFLSLVAPRGIVVASVATLFAVELQTDVSNVPAESAQILTGTVFLVIFVTVVFQGGGARYIAKRLDVIPMNTVIIGAGRVGTELAQRLEQDGENVILVEKDPDAAQKAREMGLSIIEGDGTDTDVLERAGINNAKTVITATPSDQTNLLICEVVDTQYDVEKLISRVHDPNKVDAFDRMGIDAISESLATAFSIENALERPALSTWMNELGRTGDVQEVEVTAKNMEGKTIAAVNSEIPDGCIVALVTHEDGQTRAPNGDEVLHVGDRVTFIGQREAVRAAIRRFHPTD